MIYIVNKEINVLCCLCGKRHSIDTEDKAPDIKSKLQWGVIFSIVWPITMPIAIVCMIAYLGKQLSKLFAKFRTKGTKK